MSETYVPMIPSSVAGPLGIVHLPRIWLKASLEACGKLAPGYCAIVKGFDQKVIEGIGLTTDAVKQCIAERRPSYAQFEAWIKAQPGVKLDRATIYKVNQIVFSYHYDDELKKKILDSTGFPNDGSVLGASAELNSLDDWQTFYETVLK